MIPHDIGAEPLQGPSNVIAVAFAEDARDLLLNVVAVVKFRVGRQIVRFAL